MCSIFESEKPDQGSAEKPEGDSAGRKAEGGSKKEGKKPNKVSTAKKGKAIKVLMRMGVSECAGNSWADEPKILQVVAKMGVSGVLPSQFLAFLLSLSYHVGHSNDPGLIPGTPCFPQAVLNVPAKWGPDERLTRWLSPQWPNL